MKEVRNEVSYKTEWELRILWHSAKEKISLPKEETTQCLQELDDYINLFIEDGLVENDNGYIKFSLQKSTTIDLIKYNLENKPRDFVLYGLSDSICFGGEYLFIHSLVALEYLGYLEIKSLDDGKARIYVNDKLLEGENIDSGLQYSNGKLHIKGKIITISKSENSMQHLLLKTIFSDKNKLWDFDEISEILGRDYDHKNDWNKYYQTGLKINKKIDEEIGVNNFLEITTKTVRIEEKYLE